MQCTPAAFLGEFDALDGPSISYAFEYFHYANDCGGSDNGNDMSFLHVQHRLAYVTGNSLIGRHVASGSLNPEYAPYMQQVASRALVSNEREDETVMFQDPDCPFVASYSFCLADILARGERRRFCIIFIHPSAALLSRWTQLMKHLRHRIDLWRSTAEGRQREEYSSIPDLEQRRESARRERLRSFMELIAPGPCTTAEESFRSVHIFFESLFPTVFSSTPKPLILNNLEPSDGESERRRLEALQIQAECATEFVESGRAAVEKDIIFLRSSTRHMLLAPSSFVVQPLSVWLVDFAHCNGFPTDVWKSSLSLLLESLCSGNQILVTGERASDCANLAISLAQILPRSLSSLRIGSSRYLMPYECRILSFDQAWLDANEISNRLLAKYAGQQQHTASTTKNRWEFPEMGSGEVVNVVVATNGHISSIHEVQTWGSPGAQSALARECSSTLVTRMCADLEACTESIKEGDSLPSNISAYQLFQARLGQLIREYVLRGRVYTQLYQMQEVNANNGVLNLVRQPSHSSRNGSSFAFLHNWLRTLGSLTQGNTSACHSGEANVEKQLRLRAESVERRLGKQQFTFTSFSNEDHAVLTFLGSRQFYTATD